MSVVSILNMEYMDYGYIGRTNIQYMYIYMLYFVRYVNFSPVRQLCESISC